MKRQCPTPLDERNENFKEKCSTRATLQEKEVAQFAACDSFMCHFSFSSTIIYDASNQNKIQHYTESGL
jgi:uncharacterized phage-like protein YoqJ